jgi:glycerophosphoryl diester phosphodiesterase
MRKHLKTQFDVAIIAHRGFSTKYPENTLLAFQKALEANSDYIELDVMLTKDGVLVVTHDNSTERLTGKNYQVEQTDFTKLRTLDFGLGEKLPTLEEVFDLCKGKMGVQIELKSTGSAQPTVELISKNGMENEVLISSFKHSELAKVKELNPTLICAVLEPTLINKISIVKSFFNRKIFIDHAEEYGVEGIHPLYPYVLYPPFRNRFCKKAHEKGLFVNVWTIDNPKTWKKLINSGVDGIITNNPEALYDFLSK